MQRNWIGKSKGTLIDFDIEDSEKKLTVFTTRPDTFYGITYLVYAPEHPDVADLVKGTEYESKVKKFVEKVLLEDKFSRTDDNKEKEGMFIGKYAINSITKEKIPIYIANFVLYEYGTGAIIAVPAHDQRDFEFAKKYDIPIKVVINPHDFDLEASKMSRAYMGDGNMVNSEDFDGMNNRDAISEITKFLKKNKCGNFTTQYKLRDWLVSRQRFWGTPIPIIYCDKCGAVPVPEKDLPVKLPENIKFTSAKNPLVDHEPFVNVKCPKCKGDARRETDTMDTFVNSSWYFLRYCDAKNDKEIFSKDKANYWMPIDQYIGGKEHACMHLIYFRFYTKFLRDLGLIKFDEPCINLFNQGMLHKDGVVMSKSKGNVILPEEVSDKYGIDTGRLFLMFVAGPDKDMEWNEEGVEGSFRFLNKFYGLLDKKLVLTNDTKQESKINKAIKDVTVNIESFKFNLAIISLMDVVNYLHTKDSVNKSVIERLVLLMSPFTPHICEEMWSKLGNKDFISLAKWPKFNESKIDEAGEAEEESISLLLADITKVMDLAKLDKLSKITVFVSESWKYDFFSKLKKKLASTRNIGEIIPACIIKGHEKDVSSLVPKLLKNESRIPKVIISQKDELKNLLDNKSKIEDQFKCSVEIISADGSSEVKAKQAMPSKPAVLVE
jgi:leucyl-tRNA synthetase